MTGRTGWLERQPGFVRAAAVLAMLFLALSAASQARAFDARTVTVKVGYGAGGSFDGEARLLSRHIGRFLPGNPSIVVQNVPGGGSMRLTQLMLGSEPGDGSVIGGIGAGLPYAPVLDPSSADFDPLGLGLIGALTQDPPSCIVSRSSGVDTVDNFVGEKFLMGASGKSSLTYLLAALARNALDARFDIVTGFDGAADLALATQRGEIAGYCIASRIYLGDDVHIMVRFGQGEIEGHESVPGLRELVQDEDLHEAIAFVEATTAYGLLFATPAGTPAATVEVFRAAFEAMVADPLFIADAAGIVDFNLQPASGAELEKELRERLAADPAVFELARGLVR